MRLLNFMPRLLIYAFIAITVAAVVLAMFVNWGPNFKVDDTKHFAIGNVAVDLGLLGEKRWSGSNSYFQCNFTMHSWTIVNPAINWGGGMWGYRNYGGTYGAYVDYGSTANVPTWGWAVVGKQSVRPPTRMTITERYVEIFISATAAIVLAKLCIAGLATIWLIRNRQKIRSYLPGFPVIMRNDPAIESGAGDRAKPD